MCTRCKPTKIFRVTLTLQDGSYQQKDLKTKALAMQQIAQWAMWPFDIEQHYSNGFDTEKRTLTVEVR